MRKALFLLPVPALAAMVTGCPSNSPKTAQPGNQPDLLYAALDTTVAPGDDFVTFGPWGSTR
ncbi:MAG TPA: hypothetical protein VF629_14330 [Hymenobacter sp.]|jgi:putative endopeptidase|uniref:hypothetical protein n=1 Tax=Hymenobacter sp. TaxID=1898978 RepID=UPI002ED97039